MTATDGVPIEHSLDDCTRDQIRVLVAGLPRSVVPPRSEYQSWLAQDLLREEIRRSLRCGGVAERLGIELPL